MGFDFICKFLLGCAGLVIVAAAVTIFVMFNRQEHIPLKPIMPKSDVPQVPENLMRLPEQRYDATSGTITVTPHQVPSKIIITFE